MCPIHTHPYFRNKEVAMEQAGLIIPLNSDGYKRVVDAENAGIRPKNVPVDQTFHVNGKVYKSKE